MAESRGRAPANAPHGQTPAGGESESTSTDEGRASPDTTAQTGTVAGAPNPAVGGGSSTTASTQYQQGQAEQGPQDEHELSEEEQAQNREFRIRHERSLGRGLSDLERERLELLGPAALGIRERGPNVAYTVAGPVDHLDSAMSDKDMWKRSEAQYLKNNQSEVERAAQDAENAGLEGLITVKSGLTGDNKDRVAFTEYNPMHPHGFAYVAGSDSPPQIIAMTPEVQSALLASRIVRVDAELPEPVSKHVQETPKRRR
jgi:hypothetical protein